MEVENEGLWEVRFGSWKVWDECIGTVVIHVVINVEFSVQNHEYNKHEN